MSFPDARGDRRTADDHLGDLASGHLDGELDRDVETRVSDHLERCADCRALVEETGAARALVRSLPAVDATPVVDSVLARHRTAMRAGAAFIGLASLVVGSLALTAAVIRPDVAPDVDAMVAAHRSMAGDSGERAARPSPTPGMGEVRPVRQVGTPYSAPASMEGSEMRLDRRSVYDGDDLTVVVYAAGTSTVSVFQQPGRLDWNRLPGGTVVTHRHRRGWVPSSALERSSPAVMVAQVGDVVVTAVSDDPMAVVAVVEGLPDNRRDGAWERVHDACSRLTEVFALGG